MNRRYLPFLLSAASVLLLDQVSKGWAISALVPFRPLPVLGDFLRLTLAFNPGGIFGLGRGAGPFFTAVSVAVVVLILFHLRRVRGVLRQIAFGFLAGGAVGNLVDRVRLGVVVDFIDLGYGGWRWPAFNLADAAITIGVGYLLWLSVRKG